MLLWIWGVFLSVLAVLTRPDEMSFHRTLASGAEEYLPWQWAGLSEDMAAISRKMGVVEYKDYKLFAVISAARLKPITGISHFLGIYGFWLPVPSQVEHVASMASHNVDWKRCHNRGIPIPYNTCICLPSYAPASACSRPIGGFVSLQSQLRRFPYIWKRLSHYTSLRSALNIISVLDLILIFVVALFIVWRILYALRLFHLHSWFVLREGFSLRNVLALVTSHFSHYSLAHFGWTLYSLFMNIPYIYAQIGGAEFARFTWIVLGVLTCTHIVHRFMRGGTSQSYHGLQYLLLAYYVAELIFSFRAQPRRHAFTVTSYDFTGSPMLWQELGKLLLQQILFQQMFVGQTVVIMDIASVLTAVIYFHVLY